MKLFRRLDIKGSSKLCTHRGNISNQRWSFGQELSGGSADGGDGVSEFWSFTPTIDVSVRQIL